MTFFPLAFSRTIFIPHQICCEKPLTHRENTGSSCSKGKFASFLNGEFCVSVYDHFICTEHKKNGWMAEAFIPSKGECMPREQYLRVSCFVLWFGWVSFSKLETLESLLFNLKFCFHSDKLKCGNTWNS